MTPRATITIPFFDDAATLAGAVRSVFAQGEEDWELLLFDDGSSDGGAELARAIRDPRVRVLAEARNRGDALRRNQLAMLARSPVLVVMDGDDVMHPDRLALQLEALAGAPGVDVVCSPAYVIDAAGEITGRTGDAEIGDAPGRFLLHDRVVVHPTIAARRRWAVEFPYDASFRRLSDKELLSRAHPGTSFRKLAEPLLFYRHAREFSMRRFTEHRRMERRVLRMHGPRRIGRARTAMAIGASLGKEWTYRGLRATGTAEAVYGRFANRNVAPLPAAELARARATLRRSLAAEVPGW